MQGSSDLTSVPFSSPEIPSIAGSETKTDTTIARIGKIFKACSTQASAEIAEMHVALKQVAQDELIKDFKGFESIEEIAIQFHSTLLHSDMHVSDPTFFKQTLQNIDRAISQELQSHYDGRKVLSPEQLIALAHLQAELYAHTSEVCPEARTSSLKTFQEAIHQLLEADRGPEAMALAQESAKLLPLPVTSPFANLPQAMQTTKEAVPHKGVYFSAGSVAVADSVLHVASRTVSKGETTVKQVDIDGELEPSTRKMLEKFLMQLDANPPPGVTVTKTNFEYYPNENGVFNSEAESKISLGEQWTVTFDGLGSFSIGSDPNYGAIYERFTVTQESPANGHNLQQILCQVGLGALLGEPGAAEKRRQEFLAVCWTHFPRELATIDPRDLRCLSEEALKEKFDLITNGKFSEEFEAHLSELGTKEIDVGYSIPISTTQADEVQKNGGCFLTHGIWGGGESGWAGSARFFHEKLLSSGLIPSEDRSRMGILGLGVSVAQDHMFGGSGNVFARLVPQEALDRGFSVSEMGEDRTLLLINPTVFNGRTYQYPRDCFGHRNRELSGGEQEYKTWWMNRDTAGDFASRISDIRKVTKERAKLEAESNERLPDESIPEGTAEEDMMYNWKSNNEVVIHHTVLPSEIYGSVLPNDEARAEFIQELLKYRQEINGIPVEHCVLSATSLTSEMKLDEMKKKKIQGEQS